MMNQKTCKENVLINDGEIRISPDKNGRKMNCIECMGKFTI